MFQKILVPVGFSEKDQKALVLAQRFAKQNKAEILLLHVIAEISLIDTKDMQDFYNNLEKKGQKKLENYQLLFTNDDVDAKTKIIVGEPAHEIVSHAQSEAMDMIIMGSHVISPEKGAKALGSTSYKVGIFASCPVLLAK